MKPLLLPAVFAVHHLGDRWLAIAPSEWTFAPDIRANGIARGDSGKLGLQPEARSAPSRNLARATQQGGRRCLACAQLTLR